MATRVLFVCLGNICRSPAAEGVFRHIVAEAGLDDRFVVDSAGTGAWHIGQLADERMRAAADRRGIDLTSRARQVVGSDFDDFDWILAMDDSNLAHLRRLARADAHQRIRKFRDFDPADAGADVPDPYYGAVEGFEDVLDIIERTARALLDHLRAERGTTGRKDTP